MDFNDELAKARRSCYFHEAIGIAVNTVLIVAGYHDIVQPAMDGRFPVIGMFMLSAAVVSLLILRHAAYIRNGSYAF